MSTTEISNLSLKDLVFSQDNSIDIRDCYVKTGIEGILHQLDEVFDVAYNADCFSKFEHLFHLFTPFDISLQFTIQCQEDSELLTFSIQDLNMMKNEFYEAYTQLFQNSFNRLRRLLRIKLKAIKYCHDNIYK